MLTLRDARALVKATQQQVADLAACNKQDISDLERHENQKPSHELVTRITRALQQLGLAGLSADQIEEFHVPATEPRSEVA